MASAGEADGTRDDLAFDPDVPDTGSFTTPSADGTATVDGQTYDSAQAAVDAADSGDTVTLDGRSNETLVVRTPNVTLSGSGSASTLLHGDGDGDVLAVEAPGVTVSDIASQRGTHRDERRREIVDAARSLSATAA